MSDIEHYSWCQAAQNQARPRSMQLIGPKCECREFRDSVQKSKAYFEAWLETEEGKNWLAKLEAIVDSGVLDTDREGQ